MILAIWPGLKEALLGRDYSQRLYTTIEVLLVVMVVGSVYFLIRKRWMLAIASIILAIDWLWIGIINSAV
jgi:hypothetical protein